MATNKGYSTRPLSVRALRFAKDEYPIDFNGKAAYIRAGFKARGASAEIAAFRLLKDPRVRAVIDPLLEEVAEKAGLTQEWVRERLKKEAENTNEGATHAGRVQALAWLGKHFKMFTDKIEVEDVTQHSEKQIDDRLTQLLGKAGVGETTGGEESS